MSRLKQIDIHTHYLPKSLPRFKDQFGYGGFGCLEHDPQSCKAKLIKDDGTFIRFVEPNLWEAKARLDDCDRHGVSVQVLSTVPLFFSTWAKAMDTLEISKFLNDDLANMVGKHPKRFAGLAHLPMQDPDLASRELERCIRDLGMIGAQIGSHIEDRNLSDPSLFSLYKTAEDLGACLLIHPWDMMGEARMKKYWLPWLVGMPAEGSLAICSLIFGGVLDKFPKLRIAIAHGGGSFPGTLGRIKQGFIARPDLVAIDNPNPPEASLGKFWVDSLCHDPRMLKLMIEIYGEDKIALGTDYPFPLGETEPGHVFNEAKITGILREKLERHNALLWMGKKESDFL